MVEIRKGIRQDIPRILAMVQELAEYEKEPDAVTATIEMYYNAFDEEKIKILIAEYNGEPIGMMLYYWTFSTWKGPMYYLEDFVVSEVHRGKGIGQLLFNEFMKQSKNDGVQMVKWQVLDWNQPAIDFYMKNKATIEKEWWNVKIIF